MNQPWVYVCPPSWSPLLSPSPSHPSELSQCTSFECPVSSIELGLVICFTYGNMHVSLLFSQIIPPSPSPTESKDCSLYLFLFCCLAYRVIITIFLNSIYMCLYTVLVFFFLTYFTPKGRCFYSRGKWSSERLNNVPEIKDLVPVELNVEPRLFWLLKLLCIVFSLSIKTWHYHWPKKN